MDSLIVSPSPPAAGPSGTRNGEPLPAPSTDWQKTRSGKRILELQQVEESVAQLLHFAGCTLASVHPEPLATFTDKTVDFSDGDASTAAPGDKESEFANYAEAYYTTLNDIQLSLRTSIRHLRLARASPAPLIDPHFSALSNPGGGSVGVGGLAMGADLTSVEPAPGEGEEGAGVRLSVRAREIEREAWVELESALKDDAGRMDKDGDTAGSVEADTGP